MFIHRALLLFFIFSSFGLYSESLQTERPKVKSNPILLDWKKIPWQRLKYESHSVNGGASIYTVPSNSSSMIQISIIFQASQFFMPKDKTPIFQLLPAIILRGGTKKLSYEDIMQFTNQNGLSLNVLFRGGKLSIEGRALKEDFPKLLKLISQILFETKWKEGSLETYKTELYQSFLSFLDARSLRQQYSFVVEETNKLGLGDDNFFSTTLERESINVIKKVTLKDLRALYKDIFSRNKMDVILSGHVNKVDIKKTRDLILKIPSKTPLIINWLPKRSQIKAQEKVRVSFIKKPDMKQSSLVFRAIFTHQGKLNPLEKFKMLLLSNVFSSQAGVVGSDRVSTALRVDSGLSYAPSAYFADDILYPNTNLGSFNIFFQSPDERLYEAIDIAYKTWSKFITKGITQDELEKTRVSLMNQMLAQEETIFDKSQGMLAYLLRGKTPDVSPRETALSYLESLKDLDDINKTLFNITHFSTVPVLAVMGNPSEGMIKKIKADSRFEIIRDNEFQTIVNRLKENR